MKKKLIFLSLIGAVVLILDQFTKYYIYTNFSLHESIPVIDGLFNLTYVRNPGAAFGMLGAAPDFFRRAFFLLITPIAALGILYFLKTVKDNDNLQIAALSLVFAGAIGNYIDRVRFEYVVDFLDFYVGDWHYPAFNIADSAIVVGLAIVFIISLFEDKKEA